MATCNKCKVELSDTNWYPSSQKNYNYMCNPCMSKKNKSNRKKRGQEWLEYRKAYAKSRTRENRCYNLRNTYGLTADEWDGLFESQGNVCKICGTDEEPSMGWHTDHCHKTGKIRGILCMNCNNGLGRFKDDPELLKTAVKYLSDLV